MNSINRLKKYMIVGFIFTSILGTLLHFTYKWSGYDFFVGLISAQNESTLEHMKLLFFPALFYSLFIIKKFSNKYNCIIPSMLLGVIIGTFLIPILFYFYTWILGTNFLFIDISIFLISVAATYFLSYRQILSCSLNKYKDKIIIICAAMCLLFFIFPFL